jgi:hypothetical protein
MALPFFAPGRGKIIASVRRIVHEREAMGDRDSDLPGASQAVWRPRDAASGADDTAHGLISTGPLSMHLSDVIPVSDRCGRRGDAWRQLRDHRND